jgi:hypothetical protein
VVGHALFTILTFASSILRQFLPTRHICAVLNTVAGMGDPCNQMRRTPRS